MCTALKLVCMHVAYIHWRLILYVSQMGMILEVTRLYYRKGRQKNELISLSLFYSTGWEIVSGDPWL